MTEAVQEIAVALCRPSPTARPVQPIKVEVLARSIAEVGLRQPINVRPAGDGYEIRGGGHRHAAFVSLGRETIPAFVRSDDDLHAELAEIDENLIRNELSPAERAISIARRKAIYEELHPETAHGAIGGGHEQSRQVGDSASKAPRFTKDTAKNTGASERTVQRDAGRGEAISEEHLRAVTGTSLDKGEELDALAKLPEDKRANIIDRAKAGEKVSAKIEAKKDKRETREADLGAKQIALPDKKFGVILADPEWRFEPYSRETGMDRAADNHYPTSETDVIASRPVASIAADDCVLFLWATAPMLPQALKVMEAWGFAYKTHMIWNKDRIGTGYWFRNKHEILLVGTKGEIPAPAMGTQAGSVLDAPVGAHSEKPEDSYRIIELYYPTLPKMELNARRRREGWDAWGLEAPEIIGIDPGAGDDITTYIDPETGEIIETAGEATAEPAITTEQSDNRDEAERPVAELRNAGGEDVDPQESASAKSETTGAGEGATSSVPVRDRPNFIEGYSKIIREMPLRTATVPDDDLTIPDDLLRVELSKKEMAMLNRLSLEDADRDEQEFITRTRKHPESATVATRNRLAEIAKSQGLTTEVGL